ncbi:MAG: hypothetical protein WBW33_14285 [Bryobacteraceae bacterium]
MPPQLIFMLHLILGYAACLLCYRSYVLPRLRAMNRIDAQRVIATVHSFRFFGLVFLLPGVVGPNLPAGFATFAAYWDFTTGILALLTLLTARVRPLFWLFVGAFNLVGTIDLIVNYYHAIKVGVPELAGQFGAAYLVPTLYVPILMITHMTAFYLLIRPEHQVVQETPAEVVSS